MKKQMNLVLSITALLVVFVSCKKKFDTPPENVIQVGKRIQSINTLLKMHTGLPLKFTEDYSVFGIVSIDENNGNMYKNIFIQDNPDDVTNPDSIRGINIRLLNSGGIYQGDYIRINLKNTVLSTYNGVYQLDSVDVDKNIVKQKTLVPITPVTITMQEAMSNLSKYSGRLVKFENVEYAESEAIAGMTYANAVTQSTENRTLTDCSGFSILVRTSGYSNFANTKIPTGNGSVIGVLSQFGSDVQLYLRTPNETSMQPIRCNGVALPTVYMSKNFDDGSITSGGWSQKRVTGTAISDWTIFGSSNPMAKISNGFPTAEDAENWLVSPKVDLSGSNNPILGFKNDVRYDGDQLQVMISTDYDGTSMPSQATWTNITSSFLMDTDANAWGIVDGGFASLTPYKTNKVYVAFKYTGNSSGGATWEVDDIIIKEN